MNKSFEIIGLLILIFLGGAFVAEAGFVLTGIQAAFAAAVVIAAIYKIYKIFKA